MATYKVGTGSQKIKLTVDISTFGLAASRAIVLDLSNTTPGLSVGHSNNATGDIPQTEIGTPSFLVKKRLSILTKINLIVDDEDERKKESENLNGIYIFDDGEEGHIEFNDPIKTVAADYSSVALYKEIDFNP